MSNSELSRANRVNLFKNLPTSILRLQILLYMQLSAYLSALNDILDNTKVTK
jgi:hypothetical protein